MSNPNAKYRIKLTVDQRQELLLISKNGKRSAKEVCHANVLLMADDNASEGRWRDVDISAALNIHVNTVARIRQKFVKEGMSLALERKPRATPPNPPKLTGREEAHLIAICCSEPPLGRVRWTLQLLAKELSARSLVVTISKETVRKSLKALDLKPWQKKRFCIPERDLPRFLAQMESVLDVYSQASDPNVPLICMDESCFELKGDVYPSIPEKPGKRRQEDYHYERNGTQAIFMIEMYHTPRNGSWLNIAEIELSILSKQCLDRRIETAALLKSELESWTEQRNREKAVIKWQFTTEDARIKLHHLYPQF